MKIVALEQTNLDKVVAEAEQEQIVVTRNGSPVAVILSTLGWDDEQLQLAQDNQFWQLIATRRSQKTISRAELEHRLSEADE
ncbi:MAG: type II toxin-antitoxin system prevent-host-death family antitoxin [Caldilineaceae bacterium]|nr:type II toxin-antitoxin system prevent-host-death family antitoxin [Caldilineaceae bacterium]